MGPEWAVVFIMIVLWVGVFGAVSGAIWQSKGGSYGSGFLIGALLGVLGLIFVAAATPARRPTNTVQGGGPVIRPSTPSITWTHTGVRYLMGYTIEPPAYGIWDRESPGPPVLRFPYSEHGKAEASAKFRELEPGAAEVGISPSLPRPPE
jgi:hypothetical protein